MHQKAVEKMQKFVAGLKTGGTKKIGILFSGGRDSSILAASLTHIVGVEFYLLTLRNGVSHGFERIEEQAARIKDMADSNGVTLHREVIDVTERFQRLVMREIEKDFTERGFGTLLACVGCKYIMHIAALEYAKETGLHAMVDGYSVRQEGFPEQTYTFMKRVENLYACEGIMACSPLYRILDTKDNINSILRSFGLEKSEGTCMFAFSFSTASSEDIINYLNALEHRMSSNYPH